ncbi:hypothetical protein LY78DRAFT_137549 [Colletotrichum sublineola]|nr:hypothetical protein LY78DRAFT_137549 [Colletotrichum sublineola]
MSPKNNHGRPLGFSVLSFVGSKWLNIMDIEHGKPAACASTKHAHVRFLRRTSDTSAVTDRPCRTFVPRSTSASVTTCKQKYIERTRFARYGHAHHWAFVRPVEGRSAHNHRFETAPRLSSVHEVHVSEVGRARDGSPPTHGGEPPDSAAKPTKPRRTRPRHGSTANHNVLCSPSSPLFLAFNHNSRI